MAEILNRKTVGAEFSKRPVKVLQFGEGNFLRAFFDWMLQIANEEGVTDMSVAVVSPRFSENQSIKSLQQQEGLYHIVLEGICGGEAVSTVKQIDVIADAFSPAADIGHYKEIIESPELRFVVSNTTEAGIRYEKDPQCCLTSVSFPAKVAAMLYHRFRHFNGDKSKGLIFLCCELIEDNGSTLREYVLRHAVENGFGEDFSRWVDESCVFADTLVDRIVPGYPTDESEVVVERIGYDDKLVVKAELYHIWAIGGRGWEQVQAELPLDKAGLNVLFMPSVKEFRDKKVRVLNGSHTAMAVVALQLGCDTVKSAFDMPLLNNYINTMVETEVLPVIDGEQEELRQFADSILERFYNPYIKHYLKSIALNSLSKWEARNFPTVVDYVSQNGKLPKREVFSFAALMSLYAPDSGFERNDNDAHLQIIDDAWAAGGTMEDVLKRILSSGIFMADFEATTPGFTALVAKYLADIRKNGMEHALKNLE